MQFITARVCVIPVIDHERSPGLSLLQINQRADKEVRGDNHAKVIIMVCSEFSREPVGSYSCTAAREKYSYAGKKVGDMFNHMYLCVSICIKSNGSDCCRCDAVTSASLMYST